MKSRQILLSVLVIGLAVSAARAGLFFHKPGGTPPPGPPRAIEHTHHRAGDPQRIAPHAVPSNTHQSVGGYVGGGGSTHGGDPRFIEEGTWGWDYAGGCIPRRIWLPWNHGRRPLAHPGTYAQEGQPIPDVSNYSH